MTLQLVFLLGGFVLAAAAAPMVFGDVTPPLPSSLATVVPLVAFTAAFTYQRQYVSATGTGLNAVMWTALAVRAVA